MPRSHDHPSVDPGTGQWLRPALALLMVLVLAVPLAVRAQDDDEDEPEADAPAPIVSTRIGEVPTTGGRRPGPFDQAPPAVVRRAGVRPLAIQIEQAAVDAEVEALQVVDGAMQDPTGPWVVAWYENLAGLGEVGNVVMAGHIDYWNVGPAVFYTINQLAPGDAIDVTGADGQVYTYQVEWVRQYDAANAPLDEIVGQTDGEALTLITGGGTFDYTNGQYLQRTVVRATRVEAPTTAPDGEG